VAVEHECLKAVVDGLDVVVATSCAILGPNDFKPSPMGRLLLDFANGRLRAFVPGGFEFVAARDIVQGHLLAMAKGRTGHKYIFSTEFKTVDELMEIYEAVTGRPRPRLRLPAPAMLALAHVMSVVRRRLAPGRPQRFTPGAVRILGMQRRADITKARTELGYAPTSIRQAIEEQYRFFVGRGWVGAARGVR
jgi:nucleoside-diphosphate-sugar epimerase